MRLRCARHVIILRVILRFVLRIINITALVSKWLYSGGVHRHESVRSAFTIFIKEGMTHV